MPDLKNKPAANASLYGPSVSLGLNMAVGMAVFAGLGYFIDQKTGGGQAWTLAGIFLGLLYCGYEVWKMIRRLNNRG